MKKIQFEKKLSSVSDGQVHSFDMLLTSMKHFSHIAKLIWKLYLKHGKNISMNIENKGEINLK